MNSAVRTSSYLLAGVLLASVAFAQSAPTQERPPGVYKWLDRSGLLHYDDASLTEPRLTLDILDARRIAPAQDQGVPKAYVAGIAQRCMATRDRLQNYQAARTLYGRDPSGNVYPMSPTQVALAMGALARDETRYCTPDAAKNLYLAEQRSSRAASR